LPTGPQPSACNGDTTDLILTVYPAPMVTSPLSINVCSDVSFAYIVNCNIQGSTYSWSRPAVNGISTPASSGNGSEGDPITETLTNSTNNPIIVYYQITPNLLVGDTCQGITSTLMVTVNPVPDISSPLSSSICSNEEFIYQITSNVVGSSFQWVRPFVPGIANPAATGNGNIINETLSNNSISVKDAIYTLTPTGPGSTACIGNPVNLVVHVYPNPMVISPIKDTVCTDDLVNYQIISDVAGSSFLWERPTIQGIENEYNSGTTDVISEILINTTSDPINVQYNITPNGPAPLYCPGQISVIEITVLPRPILDLGNDTCLKENQHILLDAGNVGLDYLWSTGETTQVINYSLEGPYSNVVTVILSSKYCSNVTDQIKIDLCPLIDVPNAFSPNADNINDVLYLVGYGVMTVDFKIYDRWGNIVFQSDKMSLGWDGRYNGKPQEMEVYFYTLEGAFINNEPFKQKGNITLLR
jgi:gliding motility-associated-like protein